MSAVRKRPPPTRWGDREGRRRDILAAARALLEESDFKALNMRTLAERAGVSTGTLYLYFKTQEAIFLTLYSERMDALREVTQVAYQEAETLEELIRRFAGEYLRFYREIGRHLNLWALMADPAAVEDLPPELIAGLRERLGAMFLEGRAKMEALAELEGLTLIEPERALPFLWMTLAGLADSFTGVRAQGQAFDWDEMIDFAAQALVRGLTEPRPPRRPKRGGKR